MICSEKFKNIFNSRSYALFVLKYELINRLYNSLITKNIHLNPIILVKRTNNQNSASKVKPSWKETPKTSAHVSFWLHAHTLECVSAYAHSYLITFSICDPTYCIYKYLTRLIYFSDQL